MSSVIVTMLIELIIALFMALAIRRGKRKVLSAAFAFVCGLSGICSVIFGIEVLMFTYTYGVSTSFAYFGMFFFGGRICPCGHFASIIFGSKKLILPPPEA